MVGRVASLCACFVGWLIQKRNSHKALLGTMVGRVVSFCACLVSRFIRRRNSEKPSLTLKWEGLVVWRERGVCEPAWVYVWVWMLPSLLLLGRINTKEYKGSVVVFVCPVCIVCNYKDCVFDWAVATQALCSLKHSCVWQSSSCAGSVQSETQLCLTEQQPSGLCVVWNTVVSDRAAGAQVLCSLKHSCVFDWAAAMQALCGLKHSCDWQSSGHSGFVVVWNTAVSDRAVARQALCVVFNTDVTVCRARQ